MFISDAFAQAAPAAAPQSSFLSFAPLILMVVVFYFLLIRPQQKRAKEHRAMVEALKTGDEVITAGGLLGKVTKVADQYVTLEVAEANGHAVEISLQRSAVQTLLPKGTIKSI